MEYKEVSLAKTENGVTYIKAVREDDTIDRFPLEVLSKNTPKTFRIKTTQWLQALEDGYRQNCRNQEVMMTMFEFLYESLKGGNMFEDYKAWTEEKNKK